MKSCVNCGINNKLKCNNKDIYMYLSDKNMSKSVKRAESDIQNRSKEQ